MGAGFLPESANTVHSGWGPGPASTDPALHPSRSLALAGQSSCCFLDPSYCYSGHLEKGCHCLEGPQKVHLCGIHRGGLHPKSWNARILALSGKVLGPRGLKEDMDFQCDSVTL